jgi:cysteine-rich repeat protein
MRLAKHLAFGILLALVLSPVAALGAKVDFLWVIDNSPSMAGEQAVLSSVAADLETQFARAMCPIDWRMSVVYTDAHLPPTTADVCPGAPGPGRRRVCPFTRDIDVFRNGTPDCAYVNAGTCGDGSERGFGAASIAIDDFEAGNGCASVAGAECSLRPDARLAIVFFTDTGEQTSSREPAPGQLDGSIASWVNYFSDYDLQTAGAQRAQVHGILCPGRPAPGDTTGPCSDGLANPALYERYSDVVAQMGGTEGSIQDTDQSHLSATIRTIVDAAIAGACCGNGVVEGDEQCDDGNLENGDCCSSSCRLEPAGTACRPAADACDVTEFCTGSSPTCPADGLQPVGHTCRGAVGECDTPETCTGTSPACPVDLMKPATFECRSSQGDCDLAETCTGTSAFCPTDRLKPAATECRGSAGACDPAEVCTGRSPLCPADAKSTGVCRPAAGACDVAESCDGHSNDCPSDTFKAAIVKCRASAGACDVSEFCTGTGASCPDDAFKPATVQCRASAGVCDAAELCTGSSAGCPVDAPRPAGTVCRAAAGDCDAAEVCDGQTVTCPADELRPQGDECRPAAGTCDVAEVCSGTSHDCPADVLQPAAFECRPAAGPCDLGERCTGHASSCPMDQKRLGTCRPSVGSCDPAEQCDGSSNDCPTDVHSTDGATCSDACAAAGTCTQGSCVANGPASCDDGNACTADSCEPTVGCTHTPAEGFAALTCRCDGGLSAPSCDAQLVPPGVGRKFARACLLIERAGRAKRTKARKLLAKAAKGLKVAGNLANRAKKHRTISAACGTALSRNISDLRVHTQESAHGG